jgi:hypothetical protein
MVVEVLVVVHHQLEILHPLLGIAVLIETSAVASMTIHVIETKLLKEVL